MNFKDIKIDSTKILSVGVTVLAVAGTLLSSKVDKNNRASMKADLKEEILKELSSDK